MNYIILISFILLINGTIGDTIINLHCKNISFAGGCIWQNSSFSINADIVNKTTIDVDLKFNLKIKVDNDEKSAYCRIPKMTDSNVANIYCHTKESNKNIALQEETDAYDETGDYYLHFTGSLTGTTLKCEESYLIQNLVLLIALIGLLI